MEKTTVIASALELKEKGNDYFRAKRFEEAELLFSEAINLLIGVRPLEEVYF